MSLSTAKCLPWWVAHSATTGSPGNVFVCLKAPERGGPCHTFINDVKVKADDDVVYHPDVAVECGHQAANGTTRSSQAQARSAFPCPKTNLTLDQTYEGVELPPLGVAEPDPFADAEEYASEEEV